VQWNFESRQHCTKASHTLIVIKRNEVINNARKKTYKKRIVSYNNCKKNNRMERKQPKKLKEGNGKL
jgi:hypothetical protein